MLIFKLFGHFLVPCIALKMVECLTINLYHLAGMTLNFNSVQRNRLKIRTGIQVTIFFEMISESDQIKEIRNSALVKFSKMF